ncbi:hypothetical protein Ancab_005350 [Ancistrocladus abbreviatus]
MVAAHRVALPMLLVAILMPMFVYGITMEQARNLTAEELVKAILFFGDSFFDSGNNNYILLTSIKSNFLPYGIDFFNHTPTGRFCDGRLMTDLIAEAFNMSDRVPAYLDKSAESQEIMYSKHAVSFASAGSGYDNLTATLNQVYNFSTEIGFFAEYKQNLINKVGNGSAQEILSKAVCMICMGTNDWMVNWRPHANTVSIRRRQFHNNETEYMDFLVKLMAKDIKAMHEVGCTRVGVLGVPTIGCMPFVKTTAGNLSFKCVDDFNRAAIGMNAKIQTTLQSLQQTLNIKTFYFDFYGNTSKLINNPSEYGFTVTSKGCCGTGKIEGSYICSGLIPLCPNRSEYFFWDSVHSTEEVYKLLSTAIIKSLPYNFLT